VLGSQGIVVKCTATIFFPTVDWFGITTNETGLKKNSAAFCIQAKPKPIVIFLHMFFLLPRHQHAFRLSFD